MPGTVSRTWAARDRSGRAETAETARNSEVYDADANQSSVSAAPLWTPAATAAKDGSVATRLLGVLGVVGSVLRRIAAKLGAMLLMLTVRALRTVGVLDDAGDLLVGLLVKRGRPGALTDAQRRTVRTVKDSIYARLVVEGYLSTSPGARPYPEWHALNAQLLQEGSAESAGIGVEDPDFLTGVERLVGENFSAGNSVQVLIDGPASFEQRYALIESAWHSIDLATWKIYGDETGKKTVDSLLARRRLIPGIDFGSS